MQVAFLGTSEYAATVMRRLASSDLAPAVVVTPPDRRRGRGRKLGSPPVADAARALDLELIQATSVNDPATAEAVMAARPELGLVCAFGQLIGVPLLDELELLNIHPSLLPRWRGAAPIERAILAGDAETGITVIRVTAGLDSGPIALQRPLAITSDDDYGSLSARLAELGGELAVEALGRHRDRTLAFAEQDDALATYAEKIGPADRRLDPARPAEELERAVRALTPHVGAYLQLEGGERLAVSAAAARDEDREPGALAAADGVLVLGCAAGSLRLLEVKPAGGRVMSADAYLRGHAVPSLAAG